MDWLPKEIVLRANSLKEDYNILFEVFKHDFIDSKVVFRGEVVRFQEAEDKQLPMGFPHGFTHLVTHEDNSTHQRFIDYNRATKISWIKAIIEHCNDDAVIIIERQQSNAKYGITDNVYLWLKEKDFVVILRRIPRGKYKGQMLITAYAITESFARRKLERYLKEYQEKRERPGGALYS